MSNLSQYRLRRAVAADAGPIKDLIHSVGINPMSLHWQHFWLAVDEHGQMVGCGQVKTHGDGSRELASIAVVEAWRGRGVARQIIEQLLNENPGMLYLICRASLEPLYEKFGFHSIGFAEMPPYFKRLYRLAGLFQRLAGSMGGMRIMVRGKAV